MALAALTTALIAPDTAHAALVEQVRRCHLCIPAGMMPVAVIKG
jgi:hypothetical protein